MISTLGAPPAVLAAGGAPAALGFVELAISFGNLLALYMQDEAMGTTAVDQSGNGRDGTYEGDFLLAQGSLFLNGQFDSAHYAQTATCGGVRIPDEAALRLTTKGTLVAMVAADAFGGSFGPAIGKITFAAGFQDGFVLMYQNTVAGAVMYAGGAQVASITAPQSRDTQPRMIGLSWDGSDATLYLDGKPVASSGAWAAAGDSTGTDLMLGRNTGDIQDLALIGRGQAALLYSEPLNDAQHLALMDATGGPFAYWSQITPNAGGHYAPTGVWPAAGNAVIEGDNFNHDGLRTVTAARLDDGSQSVPLVIVAQDDDTITVNTGAGTLDNEATYTLYATLSDVGEVNTGLTVIVTDAPVFFSATPTSILQGETWAPGSTDGTITGLNFTLGGRTVLSARLDDGGGENVPLTISTQTNTQIEATSGAGTFSNQSSHQLYVTFSDVGEVDSGRSVNVL